MKNMTKMFVGSLFAASLFLGCNTVDSVSGRANLQNIIKSNKTIVYTSSTETTDTNSSIYQKNVIKDGKYDNHPAFVDESQYSITELVKSVEQINAKKTFALTIYKADGTEQKFPPGDLQGMGSSLVLKKEDGFAYLLTNKHVVDPAIPIPALVGSLRGMTMEKGVKIENTNNSVFVTKNGEDFMGEVVLESEELDFALVKIKDTNNNFKVFPYKIGNSDNLEQGDFTYVLGSPLGLEDYVLNGNITQLKIDEMKQTFTPFGMMSKKVENPNYFMIGSSLLPGYSGGPTIAIKDGEYELIGIVNSGLVRQDFDVTKGAMVPDPYADYGRGIKINPIMEKIDGYFAEIKEQKRLAEEKKKLAEEQKKLAEKEDKGLEESYDQFLEEDERMRDVGPSNKGEEIEDHVE